MTQSRYDETVQKSFIDITVGLILLQILDTPDGHRAPAPIQRCSSGSQSEPSPEPLDPSLLSPCPSPCPLDPSLLLTSHSSHALNPLLSQSPCHMVEPGKTTLSFNFVPVYWVLHKLDISDPTELEDCKVLCPSPSKLLPSFALDPPLMQPCSSSPWPNKTYSFQREPPEGCERVRVCDETM